MIRTVEELVAVVNQLHATRSRVIIGIVGEPGSGKSSLAEAISQRIGYPSVIIPMDGFHLSNTQLKRLDRCDRKGAPDTFDVAGYVNLLARLTDPRERVVYGPDYIREIEEPIAGAIAVPSDTPVVFTEGNYLLYDDNEWSSVASFLDHKWYLNSDSESRIERLIRRHERFGKSHEDATAWATGSDEHNARIVRHTRASADLAIDANSVFNEIESSTRSSVLSVTHSKRCERPIYP